MLTLQIKEKEIENLTPEEKFVRGTVGAKCQINFDEFWQGYEKYIVFKRVGYEPINIIVDSLENEIEIPYTILVESGEFKIGVFGITETETLPTLYSKDIKILYGTDTHGTTPPTYIPSEIDQLRLSKQDKLVSGENIKTVNGESVLGSGNIKIQVEVDPTYTPKSENAQSGIAVAQAVADKPTLYSGTQFSISDPTLLRLDTVVQGKVSYKVGDIYFNTNEKRYYIFTNVVSAENDMGTSRVGYESLNLPIDGVYNPQSGFPQSGKAVAEAINEKIETFELIADITTEEEVSNITIPLEHEYKKIIAVGRISNKVSEVRNWEVDLDENYGFEVRFGSTQSHQNFRILAAIELGKTVDVDTYDWGGKNGALVILNDRFEKFHKRFRIVNYYNVVFPIGTTLKLYGVRL